VNTGSRDEQIILANLDRIADALQRIADALETKVYGVTRTEVREKLRKEAQK
jgi:hypothetical protein